MQQEEKTSPKLVGFFKHTAQISFYLMAGLVPLTFLPWTVEPLEVNKQTLVLLLTTIAVIAWLGMMVTEKRFYFKKNAIFIIAGLFIVAVAISSAFSIAPFVSWIGQGKQEYMSFLSFLGFGLIFLTGSHFLSETNVQRVVWSVSLLASAVVGLFAILDQVGIHIISTNFIGSPNALGLYLVVMATVGSGLWLVANPRMTKRVLPKGWIGSVVQGSILITIVSALLVALALDYWMIWVTILVGLGCIFVFTILRAEEFPHTGRFVLPMILFVCALLFLFLPSFALTRYPVEVAPSHATTWHLATDTLRDYHWLLGSGPGTFVMDYVKHQPVEVNKSSLWDQRFDRGSSYILTMFATLGILGTALFLIFMGWVKMSALKLLLSEKAHDEWKMTFVAFSGWAVLAFAMFTYSSNFTLSFLFWLLSAVIVSQVGPAVKRVSFSQSPRFGLLTAFLFVLVSVGLLTMAFVTTSRYASEIAFANAVEKDHAGAEIDDIIEKLDTAARLNKLSDIYYRNLGNALLVKTASIIQDPEVNPSDVEMYIKASIQAASHAANISPSYVVNWALLGDVYREVAPLVDGADVLSIAAYTKAVELSPNNPKYRVMLARGYIIQADRNNEFVSSEDEEFAKQSMDIRDKSLESAVTILNEAIEIKSDYAPAHYYLAGAYERQGNLTDAISRMESLRNAHKLDIGIAFQLGLLYMRQGKIDEARAELERSLTIAPNYSNALWYLSAIYEQAGEKQKSLDALEKVKELNPNNSLVDQRIERVNTGTVIKPIPDPLEEGEDSVTNVEDLTSSETTP